MPYKSILWPTDTRPSSLPALQKAIELAEVFEAKLLILHVVTPVPAPSATTNFILPEPTTIDIPMYEQQITDAFKDRIRQIVAEHVPKDITVDTDVRLGEIDEAIVDAAHSEHIDLIVMSTHGRTGLTHFLLGSVTERVIRRSPVPVLTVPGSSEES